MWPRKQATFVVLELPCLFWNIQKTIFLRNNLILRKLKMLINNQRLRLLVVGKLTLLKGCQRFNAISTSNLEVYERIVESSPILFLNMMNLSLPSKIWSTVNLEWTDILLFYYFVYLKVNLDLEKNKSAWWIFTQLYLCHGESWPNCYTKKWIDGESWPNDFAEKVNRGEELRWVGSRWHLMCALAMWESQISLIFLRSTSIRISVIYFFACCALLVTCSSCVKQ